MFTPDDLRTLLRAQPFVPFRLHRSEGEAVEVKNKEVVLVGRQCAIVGLLDADATDTLIGGWIVVRYAYITRVEMLGVGAPSFSPPPGCV